MNWVTFYIICLILLETLIIPRVTKKVYLILIGFAAIVLQFIPVFTVGNEVQNLLYLLICYGILNSALLTSLILRQIQGPTKKGKHNDTRRKPEISRESIQLFLSLDDWLKREKVYLDPSMKLKTVAQHLHVSEKQVSSAINEIAGENFNAYINGLRIEEAKKLIRNPENDNYTIDAIAELAGFSNKVSFYSAFKRKTQQSPAEYKVTKHSQL